MWYARGGSMAQWFKGQAQGPVPVALRSGTIPGTEGQTSVQALAVSREDRHSCAKGHRLPESSGCRGRCRDPHS